MRKNDVEFAPSAFKHHYSEAEIVHAIINAEVEADIPGRDGLKDAVLYIGHPGPNADHYIEVMAEVDT